MPQIDDPDSMRGEARNIGQDPMATGANRPLSQNPWVSVGNTRCLSGPPDRRNPCAIPLAMTPNPVLPRQWRGPLPGIPHRVPSHQPHSVANHAVHVSSPVRRRYVASGMVRTEGIRRDRIPPKMTAKAMAMTCPSDRSGTKRMLSRAASVVWVKRTPTLRFILVTVLACTLLQRANLLVDTKDK